MRVQTATACFPGLDLHACVARLHAGIEEPLFGQLHADAVQVCPQTPGHITEDVCEELASLWPSTRFRLHANARVDSRLRILDASTFSDATLPYYRMLADRSRRLSAPAYSLHAGYRANSSFAAMLDSVRRLEDLFGIPVAVEGLYPREDRPQLMDRWAEYEAVMRSGLHLALDLSHLNILRAKEGDHLDLAAELIRYQGTIEIHVSGNDGRRDAHSVLSAAPWWMPLLEQAPSHALIFSEGNQLRPHESRRNFDGSRRMSRSHHANAEEQ